MTDRVSLEISSADLPMVDVYLPMMKSAALISAGELGLFQALADGPLDAAALAGRLKASPEGVTRLTDLLVSLDYLVRDGERLANSAHAARWFTRAGEVDYTAGLLWTGQAWSLMASLTDCVRQGGPQTTLWERMESQPAWGPVFSRYMHAFARHLGPDLLAHAALTSPPKRLLDLGGSHGLHAMAFCRAYPELQAVIVDQASALADTPQTLRDAGLADRIEARAGDLRSTDWGGDYDVVLFLSVMHNQTAQECRAALQRVAQALRPGGTLIIHEYPADRPLSVYDAAFRVTLLTETGTGTHASEAIRGWLAEAGLGEPRQIELSPREKGSLLIARR